MKQLKNGRAAKLGIKCAPNLDTLLPEIEKEIRKDPLHNFPTKQESDIINNPSQSLIYSPSKEYQFDPELLPNHPVNKEAASKLGLNYDPKEKIYRDDEGRMMRDQFGQSIE